MFINRVLIIIAWKLIVLLLPGNRILFHKLNNNINNIQLEIQNELEHFNLVFIKIFKV